MNNLPKVTVRQTLSIYWRHAKEYPRHLAGLLIFMPIIQLLDDFAVPLITSVVLNKLVKSNGNIQIDEFYLPIAAILALELSINFMWRPYVKIVWSFEELVMRRLQQTSFDHLMKMSYRFYSDRFAGSLVNQVNKFSGSFERLADTFTWNIYKLIISFVFTVAILIKPAPLYVLVLVLFSAIYVILLVHLKKSENALNAEWASLESARTGQLSDTISNITAVKSFGHEALEKKLYDARTKDVLDISLKTMHKVMANERYTTTSQRAINAFSILVGVYLGISLHISVGLVYLILTYTLRISQRLWDLNSVVRNLNRVIGDARDMTAILQIPPEVDDVPGAKDLTPGRGDLRLTDVSFSYKDASKKLFDGLNLHIRPGEKIGLVGPSGGGKTTVTKLLLRFMDIQSGQILLDNQDIARVTQQSLRRAIAYVPQEPLMFHRSISDNIRYGQLDASDKAVRACARLANADEFIKKLPSGYDTLVGERGTKLSGGQRQRIAIARAMLKNAPILVLDEATSALDSESEVLIQDALWKLMEGRTAIVIAHRLSTIQKMDRILVLDGGRVVEQGSHKALLAAGGLYAKLWSHQSGGFIED